MRKDNSPDFYSFIASRPSFTCQVIVLFWLIGFALNAQGSASYSSSGPWIDGTHSLLERVHHLVDANDVVGAAPKNIAAQDGHPQIGDQKKFYGIDFARSGIPYFTNATCRAVGDFCYIFVEDEQWQNGLVNHTDVVKLKRAFDESTPADGSKGIYELEAENLGPPPDDIDQDPKIYILILDIPDNFASTGNYIAGYFEPINQKRGVLREPNTGVKFYSNEVEMVYIDSHPLDVGSELSKEILAHEFQHLIHWRHDPNEDIWVNEGCSDYAALFLCGYNQSLSMHLETFENNPQTSLVYWPAGVGSSLANYGAAYLWMGYLHEHYGGVSTISSLITQPANGINGVNAILSAGGYSNGFEDIFSDWKLANFLDDTNFESGKYGYRRVDLSTRLSDRHFSYPIPKISRNMQSWAANYIEFTGGDSLSDLQIDFTIPNPSYDFDVKIIEMKNGFPVGTELMQFQEGTNNGNISIPRFGYSTDTVILVPSWQPESWADLGGIVSYSYSARLGKKVAFNAVALPNAVHEGYVDIVVRLDEKVDDNIPKISITRSGEKLVDSQNMTPIKSPSSESDSKFDYVYQIYIPYDWDHSEIRWDVYYLSRWVVGGNLGDV